MNIALLQIRTMTPLNQSVEPYRPKDEINIFMMLNKIEISTREAQARREDAPIKPNFKISVEPSLWDRFVSWLGSIFN